MESIQVALRLRPATNEETKSAKTSKLLTDPRRKQVSIGPNQYTFDNFFDEGSSNSIVYNTAVRKVALSSIEGVNGTVLFFGESGSGKTHTIFGRASLHKEILDAVSHEKKSADFHEHSISIDDMDVHKNDGMLMLSIIDLFNEIKKQKKSKFFSVKCSYFEVYNEQIFDLLKKYQDFSESLPLVEDLSKEQFSVKGLIESSVSSPEECFEKIRQGEINRCFSSVKFGHDLSWSHSVFRITVTCIENILYRDYKMNESYLIDSSSNLNYSAPDDWGKVDSRLSILSHSGLQSKVTRSALNFVKVGGVEKLENKKHEVGKDSKSLRKSLYFLNNVASIMSETNNDGNVFVPFRNSQLTKILRPSLGGNSRTLVMLCTSPSSSKIEATLKFGNNLRNVQNQVRVNLVTQNNDEVIKILMSNLEGRVADLESENHLLREKLINLSFIFNEKKIENEELREKIKLLSAESIEKNKVLEIENVSNFSYFYKPESENKKLVSKVSTSDEATPVFEEYKTLKSEFSRFQENFSFFDNLSKSLPSLHDTLKDQLKSIHQFTEKIFDALKLTASEYRQEYFLCSVSLLKLKFYENLEGITQMSDRDLCNLKDYLKDFGKVVSDEIVRRELLKKTKNAEAVAKLTSKAILEQKQKESDLESFKLKLAKFNSFIEECTFERENFQVLAQNLMKGVMNSEIFSEIKKIQNFGSIVTEIKQNFELFESKCEIDGPDDLKVIIQEIKSKLQQFAIKIESKPERLESNISTNAKENFSPDNKESSEGDDKSALREKSDIFYSETEAPQLRKTIFDQKLDLKEILQSHHHNSAKKSNFANPNKIYDQSFSSNSNSGSKKSSIKESLPEPLSERQDLKNGNSALNTVIPKELRNLRQPLASSREHRPTRRF